MQSSMNNNRNYHREQFGTIDQISLNKILINYKPKTSQNLLQNKSPTKS